MLNGIWSFLRPCLQESKRVKDSPPLQPKYFRQGYSATWDVLNSGRSVSINLNKTRKHFSRNIHGPRMFPSFPYGKHCFQGQFYFQDAIMLTLRIHARQGILTKIRACEHLQKFCEKRTSEQSSNFCEQFEQRLNFASTFNLDGIILYPLLCGVVLQ